MLWDLFCSLLCLPNVSRMIASGCQESSRSNSWVCVHVSVPGIGELCINTLRLGGDKLTALLDACYPATCQHRATPAAPKAGAGAGVKRRLDSSGVPQSGLFQRPGLECRRGLYRSLHLCVLVSLRTWKHFLLFISNNSVPGYLGGHWCLGRSELGNLPAPTCTASTAAEQHICVVRMRTNVSYVSFAYLHPCQTGLANRVMPYIAS